MDLLPARPVFVSHGASTAPCGTTRGSYAAFILLFLSSCSVAGCGTAGGLVLVGTPPVTDALIADSPPTTVYANLAQKALSCWVGPQGPLHSSHIFHAEAASPSAGGHAEIVLQERDTTSPHPWGRRVFRIQLTDVGGGTNTQITMLNIALPADLATALQTDVVAWAQGRDSCQVQVVRPPIPDPAPTPAVAAKAAPAKSR